jgi:anthranilate synthase component 1
VVLSQRFAAQTSGDDFQFYGRLRRINPSPYLFYLHFDQTRLIGASPEILVRLRGRQIEYRPIAGTRPRGRDAAADEAMKRDLLQDIKERAEHIMLVDLGRNDVGKAAEAGTVRVPQLMGVEYYSHVMHIVSQVEGRLRSDLDGFDLFRSVFPAGTVSGAPKIRAMEIIRELEPTRRGPYAGAVGFFAFNGDLDFCITIRTLCIHRDRLSVQAGAGIVFDSIPENEYAETLKKAGAPFRALGLEDGHDFDDR